MLLDISGIKSDLRKISDGFSNCKHCFHSTWDDLLHDSFEDFIKKLSSSGNDLSAFERKLVGIDIKVGTIKDHNFFTAEIDAQKIFIKGMIL